MKVIKLVYDKYENDYGFTEGEIGDHVHDRIEQIGDKQIDTDKILKINTWGLKKHIPVECDVIFDASLFSTKINVDVKKLTGLDEIVQQGILNHPKFDIIIEMILTEIETTNYQKIGFICNYGKHRSVGWAEIVKKMYYPKSVINHMGITI